MKAISIRISARDLGRAGLIGIALAAALVVFVAALVVRLLIAPISLGPFADGLRASLSKTLPGLAVRFDDAALAWSSEEDRLSLVVLGARILDANQRIVAQAPEAEIGLAVVPFLKGRVVVRRITLIGVQLTLVHTKDGALRLGVGGGRNQSDVLDRIRDAIAHSGKGASALQSFAVNKARLAFYDEETGAFVVAPNAGLQITKYRGAFGDPKGILNASVSAEIEISGSPARLAAVFRMPPKGQDITGDASISGLDLRALATNAKAFRFLAPFDMRADVTDTFTLVHGTQLRSADFGIGAAGTVNGLGRPLHVRSFRITGRYDGATGRLLIDDASLEGLQARAHMDGLGNLSFDQRGSLSKASLSLHLDKIAFDMPGVMGHSVSATRAAIRGSYDPGTRTIAVDQAFVFGGPLSAKFVGRVILSDGKSPEVDLDGNVAAIGVRDFLRYWPLQIGGGARRWVDANVSAGRIGPMVVHTHLLAGDLDAPVRPENSLSINFPVSDATVAYVKGLTVLTNVNGTAVLSGDTFKADVNSGSVGPIALTEGHVVIPNLHVHGTQGQVAVHLSGSVPDVLALIDEKPLSYPSRFHIRRASAKGEAQVDIIVRIPMLHDARMANIGLSARASATGLGIALSDRLSISNGTVDFVVDNRNLRATGIVAVGGSNCGVDWSEAFEPTGPISTRLKVSSQVQVATLTALGIDASDYIAGDVGISGELDGYRGEIQRAQLKLDLAPTALMLRLMGYRKPAGIPAQMQTNLRLDAQGKVRSADFVLSGAQLSARGTARFGANGSLQALDVPAFHAGANDDFSLSLARDPAQGASVSLAGRSFDAEEFLHPGTQPHAGAASDKREESPESYRISAKLDRLALRNGVILSPFALNISGTAGRVRSLTLNANLSKTAPLTASLGNGEQGSKFTLAAGDAGLFFKGLLGTQSLKGGTLSVDATMSNGTWNGGPLSGDYNGKLSISDFTVINQPFLMRLFAAGSFGGLADLMGGKGIQLDKLDVPFTLHDDVLTVREVRAAGASLGLTADGYYDLHANKLALEGAFTPLYGINGFVGSIPVLGSLLGSKKGEGLIGVTYSASGDADDPKVVANPLSVLAPGILRRIFQGRPPTAPPVQASSATPAVPTPKPQ